MLVINAAHKFRESIHKFDMMEVESPVNNTGHSHRAALNRMPRPNLRIWTKTDDVSKFHVINLTEPHLKCEFKMPLLQFIPPTRVRVVQTVLLFSLVSTRMWISLKICRYLIRLMFHLIF